jgi:hypothetical protein
LKLAATVAAALAVIACSFEASAQHVRRRFEPTDINLQPAGVAEIDLQGGLVRGDDGTRAFAPDFEATIGISPQAELDIDGAFGFDHGTFEPLDNTLVALRVGVLDARDTPTSESAWAAGVQAGPRLPTLPGARGLGMEALAIVGRTDGPMHLFFQVGTLLDPFQPNGSGPPVRPFGIEGGVDLDLDLDAREAWSLKAELGGVKFFSPHDSQLHATAGPAIHATKSLELSLVALVGLLPGGDRYGLLLGATSRFRAF